MDASFLIGIVSACGPLNSEPALLEKFEHIVLAQYQIQLLINPNYEDQRHLGETIAAAIRRRSEGALDTETDSDIRDIVSLAQVILKSEWQRVKQGT